MNILKKLEKEVKVKMENDSAHDFEHIKRVYNNAKKLAIKEKANTKLVLSAVLLHDIVSYPKSDSRSKTSSVKSSQDAKKILKNYPFTNDEIKMGNDSAHDFVLMRSSSNNNFLKKWSNVHFLSFGSLLEQNGSSVL